MNLGLVASYSLTTALSWMVLSLLASYLSSKSITEQTIRDRFKLGLLDKSKVMTPMGVALTYQKLVLYGFDQLLSFALPTL